MNYAKELGIGILAVCLVAGCGDKSQESVKTSRDDSAPGPSTPSHKPITHSKPIAAPEGDTGVDDMASRGITLDFPHSIVYDIIDVSASGKRRHRVLVEVQKGSLQSAVNDFHQSMKHIGYELFSSKQTNERTDEMFARLGQPAFYLIIQKAGSGPKLTKQDSVGSIHIMWNM